MECSRSVAGVSPHPLGYCVLDRPHLVRTATVGEPLHERTPDSGFTRLGTCICRHPVTVVGGIDPLRRLTQPPLLLGSEGKCRNRTYPPLDTRPIHLPVEHGLLDVRRQVQQPHYLRHPRPRDAHKPREVGPVAHGPGLDQPSVVVRQGQRPRAKGP